MSANPLTVIAIIGLVIAGLQTFAPKIKLAPSSSDLNASLRPKSYSSQKGGKRRKYKTKKNRRK